MSRRNKDIRLRHMLDHAREAIALVQDKTRSDLDSDRVLNLALVRLLEIVGEAANRMSKEEQALHPEIPWPHINVDPCRLRKPHEEKCQILTPASDRKAKIDVNDSRVDS